MQVRHRLAGELQPPILPQLINISPFPGAFLFLLLVAAYAGLTKVQLGHIINDKVLHVGAFFLLTLLFYWILDAARRRVMNITLVTCTLILGIGSEFLQGFLPNDREFDVYDIVANIVGSLAALLLCSWYHKRMLERRRQNKAYNAVPGEDVEDVELGEGDGHETGVVQAQTQTQTLEEEVDNWDENAVDNWDDGDAEEEVVPPPAPPTADEPKKRTD